MDHGQWEEIHSEGNKDGQTDHVQHKTHLQDTDNNTAVPLRADC